MKTFKNCAAQGDLLLRRVTKIPKGYTAVPADKGRHIVAHSETGHHHWLPEEVEVLRKADDPMVCYLSVATPAMLKHDRSFDTHEDVMIPVGLFKLTRQREYTPEGWRRVED